MSGDTSDIHLSLLPLPAAAANLTRLGEQARRDLDALAHPASAWVRPVASPSRKHVFDVVIIGAGQAGLIVGLGLKREGIRNVLLLDRSPRDTRARGKPSPAWRCCARPKRWSAPSLTSPACRCGRGSKPATAPPRGSG